MEKAEQIEEKKPGRVGCLSILVPFAPVFIISAYLDESDKWEHFFLYAGAGAIFALLEEMRVPGKAHSQVFHLAKDALLLVPMAAFSAHTVYLAWTETEVTRSFAIGAVVTGVFIASLTIWISDYFEKGRANERPS